VTGAGPEWFYTSLAQVTASLVGFLGAFLLVRLSAYIGEWRTSANELHRLQRTWSVARSTNAGPRAEEALWEIRVLDDRRRGERFPRELPLVFVVLGLVFVVGVVLPLMALAAPAEGTRTAYVLPVALLVVAGAAIMLLAARQAFREWVKAELTEPVRRALATEREAERAYEDWLRSQQ